MQISAEIQRFVTSPVMIIMGSAGGECRPAIGRGLGVRVCGPDRIEIPFSRWQWDVIADNIEASGRLAITCSRPSDYTSYQFKGGASLRPAREDDHKLVEEYCSDIAEVLTALGVPAPAVAQWTVADDLCVAQLDLAEVYDQTPGPRAGTTL